MSVVASINSPAAWRDRAKEDGLLCDGVRDEVQFNAAWDKAASTTQKDVLVAPGNYWCDWAPHPYNAAYFSSLRPRPGTRTSAVLPGWSVLHSVAKPAALARSLKGTNNVFLWGPKEGDWTFEGVVLDLHSWDQVGGSNRADKRFQMEGLRAWGGSNVLLKDLAIQNVRGTSGSGGTDETSSLTLYQGENNAAEDILVRSTDGGDMASGFHFVGGENNTLRNCRVDGRGVIVHGFAAWYGKSNVRYEPRADSCTSSGLRREVDIDGVDMRPVVTRCGKNGIVSQQTTRHRIIDPLCVNNGNGIQVNNSLNFLVQQGFSLRNKLDINLLNNSTTGPQPGVPLLTPVSTGKFDQLTYETKALSGEATWKDYGLS